MRGLEILCQRVRAFGLGIVLLTAAAAFAQEPVAPAGEGTAEAPYKITQLGHLVWMGEHVSESAGKHYRLMNDIDASSLECLFYYGSYIEAPTGVWIGGFDPIGDAYGSAFLGVFDGAGHVVRGVKVGDRSLSGLFGVIGQGGEVRNLGVVGACVNGGTVGGIAAVVDGGTISNCWVSAVLRGYFAAGGIAGEVYGGTVFRCYVAGACQEVADVGGTSGGIVALCRSGSTVAECYAAVALKAETLGGLIAWGGDQFIVTNSYWDVETSGAATSWLGGAGKTSREMCHAETFAGWDFTNVWSIAEGSGTPCLRMFTPMFTVSVVTQEQGRIEVAPQKAVYQPGEQVTLTAHSDAPGYVFSHWVGGGSNLLTTVAKVSVTAPRTLLAVFVPATDISTVEELQAIGGTGNYRLAQDIDASATTNWNSGAGFAPVSGTFTGIFDGNGHVIRGLTINRPGQWGAVISECSGGVVRRLGVEEVSITGGCSAALVCANDGGVIEECFASGTVRGTEYFSGGLVGSNRGKVSRCHATCSVYGGNDVGGLIGVNASGCVVESFAMGNVSGHVEVGGLVGWNSPEGGGWNQVLQCFATGSVVSDGEAGGLIGWSSYSIIRQCFATGAVSSEGNAGGLIGFGAGQRLGWLNDETDVGECFAAGRIRLKNTFYLEGLLGANRWVSFQPTAYWDMENSHYWDLRVKSFRTTAQMKKRSTYEGWDFTNTWTIVEDVSYPYLRNVGTPLLLHVVAEGPGRVIVSPRKASYAPGEVVTLTAVPDTAINMLARWVGLVADEDAAVTTVTMDIHKTVTAVFVTPKDIASVEELQKIGNDAAYPADGNYRLSQDIDASATTHWNDGAGFAPIGTDFSWFCGILDGQSHAIRGMVINRPGQTYVGLIGLLHQGGSIRNLELIDCSVGGSSSVGGCVGYNRRGTVAHSFVSGSVSGSEDVGGVVGQNEGAVTTCYTCGAVAGTNEIGGLVGGQYYCGRVYESYSAASVAGDTAAGGLVGHVDEYAYGVVTQSYWDVEASGCSVSAGGEGRTTAEMRQQATYAGWDFSTVWGIDEGAGYPFLWQFRIGLPLGLGVTAGTNRPAYAAWAASHTNAWGTSDFSGVPSGDFEAAWLLDQRPVAGFAEASGLAVAGFEVGETEIRVALALTAAGAAKQGRVNAWLAVQGKATLAEEWTVVAAQPAGADRIAFADGAATVTFARPEGYTFFRPVLLPSCPASGASVRQVAP